jgi:BirA family biotin operon repressor/biotin-[acetyl-CoA-carboxylase] ligase
MIGKKIINLNTVDSTNNYFANLLKTEELINGTVILADEQTKGKGQRGSIWVSEPFKNLIMSLFLKHDNLSVNRQFVLSQMISNGIISFLKELNIEAKIKWPNDIVVSNSKIAGILIENQLEGCKIKHSIIGIGLNVNQTEFLDFNATSLKLLSNKNFNIKEISFQLIEHLNLEYVKFKNKNYEQIQSDYIKNLWLYQIETNFEDKNGIFKAKIIGIDENGRLILNKNYKKLSYENKEIVFLERK